MTEFGYDESDSMQSPDEEPVRIKIKPKPIVIKSKAKVELPPPDLDFTNPEAT